jgi:carbon storage regulator CsrA
VLVLSRKPNEKIIFPGLNVTVRLVSVKAGSARLGIEAPPGVAVLREEVLPRDGVVPPRVPAPSSAHQVNNCLNGAAVGLALLRRQLQAGLGGAAEMTIDKVERELGRLREQLEGTAARQALPRPPTRGRRALLVEDDRNECELLAGFLRLAGLEVATAGDGADALDFLRTQGRPDVVLLDMGLPRCDGLSTVRAIRQDPEFDRLKIFAVTGASPGQFAPDGRVAGIDRWFGKPLDPEALLRELDRELADRP